MRNGQYYYRPHRTRWGVWKNTVSGEVTVGTFIRDFDTKEEARQFVFANNGWKKQT